MSLETAVRRHGPCLSRRPVLHGTWKAELRTSFPDRADEEIECFIVVYQTYSRICIDMLFDRSSSRSMSADLLIEASRCVLYYVFHTHPDTLHRDGNPPARGGAALVIAREPRIHLEGDYWTERETRGWSARSGIHRSDTTRMPWPRPLRIRSRKCASQVSNVAWHRDQGACEEARAT